MGCVLNLFPSWAAILFGKAGSDTAAWLVTQSSFPTADGSKNVSTHQKVWTLLAVKIIFNLPTIDSQAARLVNYDSFITFEKQLRPPV